MFALMLSSIATAQSRGYTVSWIGVPVVDVGVGKHDKDGGTDATYTAKTRPWFDVVYSIDNRYTAHVMSGEISPRTYEKMIIERGVSDSLSATYPNPAGDGEVVYSNGITRTWYEDDHNLFSALLWLERYDWQADELVTLSVEIEGVTWQVDIHCESIDTGDASNPLAQLLVTFVGEIRGEPVLSTTDMVTQMLPGTGHRLRVNLDLKTDTIQWIELGRQPFVVRARINEASS